MVRNEDGGNDSQGEGDGACGRKKESPLGIVDPHDQGRQGDEVEKGKHDPDHQGAQGLPLRIDAPSGGQEGENVRGEEHSSQNDRNKDQGEEQEDSGIEAFGFPPPLFVQCPCQGGNEG